MNTQLFCIWMKMAFATKHLNKANLYVAQRATENAGIGLFLLPPRQGPRTKMILSDTLVSAFTLTLLDPHRRMNHTVTIVLL